MSEATKNKGWSAGPVLLLFLTTTGLFVLPLCAEQASPKAASAVADTGVITGDPGSKYRNHFMPKHEIQLATPNAKLFVGGTVNSDFYWVKHASTLNKEFKEDEYRQFRQRSEFYFWLKYGFKQNSERAAVDLYFNLANQLYMRTNAKPSFYSPASKGNIYGSDLDENYSPLQVKYKEAWFEVHFDQLVKKAEKHPHGLRVGYFPFLVGRGISLGDTHHGGISYMGFNKTGSEAYAPAYPPGILFTGQITKYSNYNVYFSPLVVEDIKAAKSPEITNINLPNDSLLNRHIIAVSMQLGSEFKDISSLLTIKEGSAMINPYWVYYNSPRNTVDRAADAPINLHTVGIMAELQAGGFEFNCEVAKQFGRQTIRERVYSDPANPNSYPSVQHFDPTTGEFRSLPASVLAQLPIGSRNPNRWFVGDNRSAASFSPGETSHVYWSEQPADKRLAEYHPSYDLKLSGWMAVFDARYSFANYPLIVSMAAGFFSGDAYPYNDAVDQHFARKNGSQVAVGTDGEINLPHQSEKNYRGFMPLRDYDYLGLWVYPMVMVNAGIVPRPKQLDLFDLSARNDTDTLTNLIYLGAGFTVRPMVDKNKLRLNANILAYWLDDDSLKKWNKKILSSQIPASIVQNEGVKDGNIRLYDEYNIKGWITDEAASKYLGWELNGVANYKITENLELSLRGGIFFPGQVYTDLDGQPNDATFIQQVNVLSQTAKGAMTNNIQSHGLGQDKAYGFYARIRYVF